MARLTRKPKIFVIGLAPDGGKLPAYAREAVAQALSAGLNVDSGLHEFLSEDAEFAALAKQHNVAFAMFAARHCAPSFIFSPAKSKK
ncbi:MAG TPA: DUF1611 domain-containing protein [Blastocatellia bacterium]|nr:DUF1611 domain-containing protein [Blastocatellia bacterium]HMV83041.1 DUF1611 domain-containing protein [Blastocatellia bacterium]HMX27986.1 DUF1611 domain-containing protein [Blastocatellia bacterium]HMY75972.1 DUF1611 domain-containing protein [Blastocatellia bacterium]HMZ17770.1 DUF1611 domain-containing protein [Blastocatellia bacterium]